MSWPESWPAWVIRDLVRMVRRGVRAADAVRLAARRWACARRWHADALRCATCGLDTLERWERHELRATPGVRDAEPKRFAAPVLLNRDGTEHACG